MIEIIAGLLVVMCMLFGVRLRFGPFAKVYTSNQKKDYRIAHIILSVAAFLMMTICLLLWPHMEAVYFMRIIGIGFSLISAVAQMLILRKYLREQLFVMFIVLACNYMIMAVPSFVGSFFSTNLGIWHFFIVVGVYFIVLLATHFFMYNTLRNAVEPFLNIDSGNYWYTLWCIPLAIFGIRLLSTGTLEVTNDIPHLIENVLSFSIILLLCKSISGDHKHMLEKHMMDQRLSQQQVHYTELAVRLEDARKLKHDFKHHIAAIRHYMDIDDKAGLGAYCDEFLTSLDAQGQIPYSGNQAADGVLYHYMQKAAQNNVAFRHTGTIRSPGIRDMDLCVLLGNALDNALTGCMTIDSDRSIALITQSEPQLLSIMVRNSFDGNIAQTDTGLLSRKREGAQHGIGLTSMRSICERYGGSMETKWDESSFTVMFILPLTESE